MIILLPLLIIYLNGFLGNCVFASESAMGCRLVVEAGASRLAKKQTDKQPNRIGTAITRGTVSLEGITA